MTEDITIKRGSVCWHRCPEVNAEQRTVTCPNCGASLDPLTVLVSLARNRESLIFKEKHQRNEINRLQARVEELKREERNVKARLERASRPKRRIVPAPLPDNVVPLGRRR